MTESDIDRYKRFFGPDSLLTRFQARVRGHQERIEPRKSVLNFAAAASILHYSLSAYKKGYSNMPLSLVRREKEKTAYYPEDTGRAMTLWGKTKGGDLTKRWKMGTTDPYKRSKRLLHLNIKEDRYGGKRHISHLSKSGEIIRPLPQYRLPVRGKGIGYETVNHRKFLGQKHTLDRPTAFTKGMTLGTKRPSHMVEKQMVRKSRPHTKYLTTQGLNRLRNASSTSDKTVYTLTQDAHTRPGQYKMSREEAKLRSTMRFFKRTSQPVTLFVQGSDKPEHACFMGRYVLDTELSELCWTREPRQYDASDDGPSALLAVGELAVFTPSSGSVPVRGTISHVDTRARAYSISYGPGRKSASKETGVPASKVQPLCLYLCSPARGVWEITPSRPEAEADSGDAGISEPLLRNAGADPLYDKEPASSPVDVQLWTVRKRKRWVAVPSVKALEKKPNKTFAQKRKERLHQQEMEEVSRLMDYDEWDQLKNAHDDDH